MTTKWVRPPNNVQHSPYNKQYVSRTHRPRYQASGWSRSISTNQMPDIYVNLYVPSPPTRGHGGDRSKLEYPSLFSDNSVWKVLATQLNMTNLRQWNAKGR